MENQRQEYRDMVSQMGKKEFTLLKMQEFGFWPNDLKTPYERQSTESEETFQKRKALTDELKKLADKIAALSKDRSEINQTLFDLGQKYRDTWDIEKIRKEIARQIMAESIQRRAERKEQREREKEERSHKWEQYKKEHIVFIGRGYSGFLKDQQNNTEKLNALELPLIEDDKALSEFLEIEYKDLRFLAYHRDVVLSDHYHFYQIPKRSGGMRDIAAPKPLLKEVQRTIQEKILSKIPVSSNAHGFLKGKSVVTGACAHEKSPALLVNMDLENFFPTITYERVRGLFHSFGYSGYIASLLAMLCTYCERMPIEVKGQTKLVKCSDRILPQGSPASPMITNIICRKLDQKIAQIAENNNFSYSRYADDMSFGFSKELDETTLPVLMRQIHTVIEEEGFKVNQKKTRFLRENNRQCITGVVINDNEIGVPKVWLKRMRAALHHAEQLKKENKLSQSKINEIAGMASWLYSVNPARYQKMIAKAKEFIKQNEIG